ncbi:MAG: hypothetical protein EAY75_13985 [Bacteroidetes bacterium]|nr:MAG: hypothetical protein EAY75_13985 [Bacteroidota bacterium]
MRGNTLWVWLFFVPLGALAQDTAIVLTAHDSAMVFKQVMEELASFQAGQAEAVDFYDIALGYGNGNFTPKAYQTRQVNPLPTGYFTANGAFLHRSGLGINLMANLMVSQQRVNLFQWSINPSYDYSKRKLATGISFYRYFNKDSLSFYVSPLVNNIYAYLLLKPGWLQPKLAVDFGWGSYDERENLRYIDTVRFPRLRPIVRALNNSLGQASVYDISFLLSVRHAFIWQLKQTQRSYIQFTPSISTVAGTAKYGSNLAFSNAGSRVRGISATQAQRLQARERQLLPQPDERFLWQNASAVLDALVSFRYIYIQAQTSLAYAIPQAFRGWNAFYSLSCGAMF